MSAPSTTSRPHPPPKPPTNLSPTCIIADFALLAGTQKITIAPLAIIQSRARLILTYEPIHIGEGCIICEKATVGVLTKPKEPPTATSHNDNAGVTLDKHVTIDVGATVEARFIGEGSTIEAGAKIGRDSIIGKYCKITPYSILPPETVLPDYTVVYGNNQQRRQKPGLEALRKRTHEKQGEVLRRLIPGNLAKWQ